MKTNSPVFIVSGGVGTSGEQLARTALAQFQQLGVPIIVVPKVRRVEDLQEVVARAATSNGIIVHTLVNAELRSRLTELARARNLMAIDLMGPLLLGLTRMLGEEPRGQPGLYRQLREDYFQRIEAIEFTVDHDDGRKSDELHRAQIILIGVSRVGKTPLSMYLSTRGWKVANIPLIKDIPPPKQLFEVDPLRVVGLTIDPAQLIGYRQRRQRLLGVKGEMGYSNLDEVQEELRAALGVFRRGGFAVVDITDKPIEESAEEVLASTTRKLKDRST